MKSKSRKRFEDNRKDVDRLLEIHADIAGNAPGRKWGVEVLNKSAVVLVCASWEAYIEDLAAEALDTIAALTRDFVALPLELRKHLAKSVKLDKNELSPWDLAGDGWKRCLKANLESLKLHHLTHWNTPSPRNIRDLYNQALGLPDVTASWQRPYLPAKKSIERLQALVELRGDIAHRSKALDPVTKARVEDDLAHITELVGFTDAAVSKHVRSITGKPLF